MPIDEKVVRGRGAMGEVENRFLRVQRGIVHPEGVDGPDPDDPADAPTIYRDEWPRSILNKVESADLPFRWSLNPYQGCEHGCSYCYARPTHEYWGLGAGLDFERVVLVKRDAAALLVKALRSPGWKAEPIMLSGATDPYQPVERRERITRSLLQVMHDHGQPVSVITKNGLILRDLDLLAPMAALRQAQVAISITSLNEDLRRAMEPRTASARVRLKAIAKLSSAGVPVHAMIAPVIPGLNDQEIPALLEAAAQAGARSASYILLRTNGPVHEVFTRWLRTHFPLRAAKVEHLTAETHGGSMSDHRSGRRFKGEGPVAQQIGALFKLMHGRHLHGRSAPPLDSSGFRRPAQGQLDLFQ
ncbi:MAG: PA0069 family radical SAM protein [Flavobacteriales bacterium]|nr:PA0069 family radical SAM protein [Flavobacteriales bacterium]